MQRFEVILPGFKGFTGGENEHVKHVCGESFEEVAKEYKHAIAIETLDCIDEIKSRTYAS